MREQQVYLTQAQKNKLRKLRISLGNKGTPLRVRSQRKPPKAVKKAIRKAANRIRYGTGGRTNGNNDRTKE